MRERRVIGLRCRALAVLTRPFVEIVDVITDIAAVLAKFRPEPVAAHLLQGSARETDIMRGLRCGEERTAMFCFCRTRWRIAIGRLWSLIPMGAFVDHVTGFPCCVGTTEHVVAPYTTLGEAGELGSGRKHSL